MFWFAVSPPVWVGECGWFFYLVNSLYCYKNLVSSWCNFVNILVLLDSGYTNLEWYSFPSPVFPVALLCNNCALLCNNCSVMKIEFCLSCSEFPLFLKFCFKIVSLRLLLIIFQVYLCTSIWALSIIYCHVELFLQLKWPWFTVSSSWVF